MWRTCFQASIFQAFMVLTCVLLPWHSFAGLPETIATIQPSVVGVGTYKRLAGQPFAILGTGFAIDKHYVATNAHVIPSLLDRKTNEKIIIYAGKGDKAKVYDAEVAAINDVYDIAILKITGTSLVPLNLSTRTVREGELYAFTGYPLSSLLGLYPVTHSGIISSITPVVVPSRNGKELTAKRIRQLRDPYFVYQLDAIAYPGNSGSPVFDPETGEVIALINKVLVKSTKESMLTDLTAITYAVPIKYLYHMISTIPN